jgi:hypothetical protein
MTDFEKMMEEFRKKWVSSKTDRDNRVNILCCCCSIDDGSDVINRNDAVEKEIGSLKKDFWMLTKSSPY